MLSNKLQQTPADKKILLSIICYILYLIISYISSMLKNTTGNIITFLFVGMISIWIFKYLKTSKILTKNTKVSIPVTTFIFILLLVAFFAVIVHPFNNINGVFKTPPVNIFNSFIIALSAGIFEEFLVRLLMFDGFAQLLKNQKYNLLQASIYSAVVFGLLHLSNLTFQSFNSTCQQIFYAIAIGLVLSFIRLRTNGILFCVLIHSLIDFQPNINSANSTTPWSTLLILFIPIMLISIWCIYQFNRKLSYDNLH